MTSEAPAREVRPYRLRLTRPLVTARGRLEFREGLVVVVREGGRAGLGEAAIVPELGTETLDESERALARGTPPEELPPAARHALTLALLDLEAQQRGVPLARLLSPEAPLVVPVSALLSAREPAELAREARAARDAGFCTLKLKVAQGPLEDDYARAAVVRDAAGPTVLLRLDANGGWDEAAALRALRRLSPLGIELCEQPVAPGDVHALRRLREASPVLVAADESMLVEAEEVLELRAADVVVLKPMALGGLRAAQALGERARAAGLGVLVTTSLDGAIARAGAAHLAAALQGVEPRFASGLATGRLLAEDLCADALAPRGGCITLDGRVPGLGLRLDAPAAP